MELPEKQGLKLLFLKATLLSLQVAVELPEKQGLKHIMYTTKPHIINSCSGTSRKTRIETPRAPAHIS